jgi:hypothetical protein
LYQKRKTFVHPRYDIGIGNARIAKHPKWYPEMKIWWVPMTALIMQKLVYYYQDKRQKRIKIDDK